MIELVNLSNYTTDLNLIKNSSENLAALLRRHELAGLEMMFCAPWDPSVHRKEWIHGVHLNFWPSWLDFWRGDEAELLRQYGSHAEIVASYGGLRREAWLDRYRDNIRQAVAAEASYVVFHVCHNRLSEVFDRTFSATDEEVVEAFIEVANALSGEIPPTMTILLENLWWPGFSLLNRGLAEVLLNNIRHDCIGFMLDTGHLMNTNLALRTQKDGIDYVLATLDGLGEYLSSVRGIHLHCSLSGDYVKQALRDARRDCTIMEAFEHVMRIDQHRPFTNPSVRRIIEKVQPDWLVHEFVHQSTEDWESKIRAQRAALKTKGG